MPDFLFTARNLINGNFGDDTDAVRYLIVPDDINIQVPTGAHVVAQMDWLNELIQSVTPAIPDLPVANRQIDNRDILIFIHGFNENENDILSNHRKLKAGLAKQLYKGAVVSFDWPCGNQALAYLDDRRKARDTASELVDGGIALLARQQSQNCRINVHLLAHSTGAFVVREAFSYADDANKIHSTAWMVSQLCFISGDVSSSSMADDSAVGASIYEHCIRFTNYHNPYDVALALSNVKRAGFGNRVGRIGLPALVPPSAVDVDCGSYFKSICDRSKDPFYSHSWYFTDDLFMYDLFHTIGGLTDRAYMDSRTVKDGELVLTALPSPMPLVTSPANV